MSDMDDVVGQLHRATGSALAIAPLAADAFSVGEGYALQRHGLQRRAAAGERFSGWKVAFAGSSAQQRFGLDQPVYGGLTEHMHVAPNSAVALSGLIQPKLEIEVALVMGRSLAPGEYTDAQVLGAIAQVAPAFEIADCRWQGWRFGAGAFLADNAAAALYCLGPRLDFDPVEHANIAYRLECAGESVGNGYTSERKDTPFANVCWLVRRLLADGQTVEAGQVVLSGALLSPIDIRPDTYKLYMFGMELALKFSADAAPT
ncbi:2-keto-4-pentenoate hydratase [Pseudomonas sp. NyZ201]|uniref:2-keto-4-pentenoate hydratase n=1 Tax=Pseudomonas sp. NyZ201 TaxID=3409857 RepID=UPI003CF7082A